MQDLRRHLATGNRAVRAIAGIDGPVLWRYSVSDPPWVPQEIQGIDYASMMLGLAAHRLGTAFITRHTDVEAWLARPR